MDDLISKIYGPPGTGKTRALTARLERAVSVFGPDRVMATTFTRAGADELRARIAQVYGWTLPPDPYRRRDFLSARLPWIGTTHSLALKLTGGTLLKGTELREFSASQGGRGNGLDPEDMDSYAWAEPGKDAVEAALAIHAAARHRMISIEAAHRLMPWGYQGPVVTPERAQVIANAYEDYKQQKHRIDFEDMLTQALTADRPPIDVVLADEVQDNSPLLWAVLNAWSEARRTVLAGDPYQALYLWSGAEPDLFINHAGSLLHLGDSHRLTQHASDRAQSVLRNGGYTEGEWLGTWTGKGAGEATDGSEFYLARTARLLSPIYHELEDTGTPYGYMRGGGPLDTRAADAFRSLHQLHQRGAIPVTAAAAIAAAAGKGYLPRGEATQLKRLADEDPMLPFSPSQLRERWGTDPTARGLGINHAEYFERVLSRHGIRAFVQPPLVRVGTIHSAKGREADTVYLIESWATLPYRNATETMEGKRAEACVAYVGMTRHRVRLHLVPGMDGNAYPNF